MADKTKKEDINNLFTPPSSLVNLILCYIDGDAKESKKPQLRGVVCDLKHSNSVLDLTKRGRE